MIKDLRKVEDRVLNILEEYPETRDSDKLLWLYYSVKYKYLRAVLGDEAYFKFKDWFLNKDTPYPESIRRSGQKIRNEKRPDLQGSSRVTRKRKQEEQAVLEWSKE